MNRTVFCKKLNQEAEGLANPPFPGPLGQQIFNEISKQSWEAWLSHQTMLINEYRLNMTDAKSREFLKQEMHKYFFGQGSEKPQGYTADN